MLPTGDIFHGRNEQTRPHHDQQICLRYVFGELRVECARYRFVKERDVRLIDFGGSVTDLNGRPEGNVPYIRR